MHLSENPRIPPRPHGRGSLRSASLDTFDPVAMHGALKPAWEYARDVVARVDAEYAELVAPKP